MFNHYSKTIRLSSSNSNGKTGVSDAVTVADEMTEVGGGVEGFEDRTGDGTAETIASTGR